MSQAKTKRKSLNCSEEDFFLMVQLVCGRPLQKHFQYVHHVNSDQHWNRGISAWLRLTEEGKQFTRCVTECGEAQTRAKLWYIKYATWYRKQHGLKYPRLGGEGDAE